MINHVLVFRMSIASSRPRAERKLVSKNYDDVSSDSGSDQVNFGNPMISSPVSSKPMVPPSSKKQAPQAKALFDFEKGLSSLSYYL